MCVGGLGVGDDSSVCVLSCNESGLCAARFLLFSFAGALSRKTGLRTGLNRGGYHNHNYVRHDGHHHLFI